MADPSQSSLSCHLLPTGPLINTLIEGSHYQSSFKHFAIYVFFRNNIIGQPASSSIFHTSFLCRKTLTGGGRRPSWQPPRIPPPREQRQLVGRSFPVRGRVTAQLARALRRPFLARHGSSTSLRSCSHPLRNGDTTSWPQ